MQQRKQKKYKTCITEGCEYPRWSRKTKMCKNHHNHKKCSMKHKSVPKDSNPIHKYKKSASRRTKAIKKVSTKQMRSNANVKVAKSKVLSKHLEEHNHFFCYSCGTTEGRIDLSHLVPISYNKSLEAVEENITFHCERCHSDWEHLTEGIKLFSDLGNLLERVKKLDESYYNKIKSKL